MSSSISLKQQDEEIEQCVVCMDYLSKTDIATLSCSHTFHLSCVKQFRRDKCPLCRCQILSNEHVTKEMVSNMCRRFTSDKRERESRSISFEDYEDYESNESNGFVRTNVGNINMVSVLLMSMYETPRNNRGSEQIIQEVFRRSVSPHPLARAINSSMPSSLPINSPPLPPPGTRMNNLAEIRGTGRQLIRPVDRVAMPRINANSQVLVDPTRLSSSRSTQQNKYYTVDELKGICRDRELPVSGTKTDLVNRIRGAI